LPVLSFPLACASGNGSISRVSRIIHSLHFLEERAS
jgi:hypothetical protein